MKPYRFRPISQVSDKRISVTDARTQLCMLLVNALSLDGFTAESLARQYRVPEAECRQRLAAARAKRERLL